MKLFSRPDKCLICATGSSDETGNEGKTVRAETAPDVQHTESTPPTRNQ